MLNLLKDQNTRKQRLVAACLSLGLLCLCIGADRWATTLNWGLWPTVVAGGLALLGALVSYVPKVGELAKDGSLITAFLLLGGYATTRPDFSRIVPLTCEVVFYLATLCALEARPPGFEKKERKRQIRDERWKLPGPGMITFMLLCLEAMVLVSWAFDWRSARIPSTLCFCVLLDAFLFALMLAVKLSIIRASCSLRPSRGEGLGMRG